MPKNIPLGSAPTKATKASLKRDWRENFVTKLIEAAFGVNEDETFVSSSFIIIDTMASDGAVNNSAA